MRHKNLRVLLAKIDSTSRIAGLISGALCIVMMLNVIADVIGRSIFNQPLRGTLEYTTYWWMPLIVALSLAGGQLRDQHLRVTVITDTLSPKTKERSEVAALVVMTVILSIIVYFSILESYEAYTIRETSHGAVMLTTWPVQIGVSLGLIILLLQTIASVTRTVVDRQSRDESRTPHPE